MQGVAGGVGFDDLGQEVSDYVDRLGHGTAVTAVIREKAPAAELWAVKVFDRELRTSGAALVAAMRWARAARADIVNLSLGTTNVDHESLLAAEVDAARAANIVIVAASPQPGQPWLPGGLPGVVRVTVDMSLDRDQCRATEASDGEIIIAASGYPRPIPGVPVERNLQGLSFAVANVTGILARSWPAWRSALLLRSDKSL